MGWRVDAGYHHRDVHLVLDCQNLLSKAKGSGRPIQVYKSDLLEPTEGNWVFPLFEAKMNQLELFKTMITHPPKESLPFEGDPPEPKVFKRRTYVTLERAIKYGVTPGCRGCERIAEGVPHTDECHERFRVCLEEERLAAKAGAAGMRAPPTPRTPAVAQHSRDASFGFVRVHGGRGW